MPLVPGNSHRVISRNIEEMIRAGHKRSQAVAAALENARKHPKAAQGGVASEPLEHLALGGLSANDGSPWFIRREEANMLNPHTGGFLNSSIAGRTDRIPQAVAADSYVIPADVVSGLGQGNSLAGADILNKALHMGPYGTTATAHSAHSSIPRAPAPFRDTGQGASLAKGGVSSHVPVIVAGGEFIIPPHIIARLGDGDMRKGHRIMDEMVRRVRVHTAKKIAKLPAPKK